MLSSDSDVDEVISYEEGHSAPPSDTDLEAADEELLFFDIVSAVGKILFPEECDRLDCKSESEGIDRLLKLRGFVPPLESMLLLDVLS